MLEGFFSIRKQGSSVFTEFRAGVTTFLAMGYIVAVNPAILTHAGLPKEATALATCLAAAVGTLLMGFYAKRPIAVAPYMGENAFIAFTVVVGLGYTWQQGLAAILVGGLLFVALTISGLRTYLARSVAPGLRFSFVVGIGLFLTFIGLKEIGFIASGPEGGQPVSLGKLSDPVTLLGVAGFALMGLFILWRIPGGVFWAIAIIYGASILAGVVDLPSKIVEYPNLDKLGEIASLWPVTDWKLDFSFFGEPAFLLAVFLPVFLMDFFDTIGTLIGVSARAGFLDEEGNLPEMHKPMLCDAIATVSGSLLGTTTSGAYIESATGVEAGGRTGLTSVVTGVLFLVTLFFVPVIGTIPACAYAPALIVVGILMMESVKKIDFTDYTEIIPAFTVIVLMPFTYNIGVGMAAGFILYPFVKLCTGKVRDISAGAWVFAALSVLFFVYYQPFGA